MCIQRATTTANPHEIILPIRQESEGVLYFDWSHMLTGYPSPDSKIIRSLDALCGTPEERRKTIESLAWEAGYKAQRMLFDSPFGSGINLLVLPERHASMEWLFTAHYDGPTWHDNAGGVLLLVELLRNWLTGPFRNAAFLFTDLEECWQSGIMAFLREPIGDDLPFRSLNTAICIDGFGGGSEFMIRTPNAFPWRFGNRIFRTDADVLNEAGIRAFSCHSSTECLRGVKVPHFDESDVLFWHVKKYMAMDLLIRILRSENVLNDLK